MRRHLVLLSIATSALVLVAFLVPLAVLVKKSAEDRATADAVAEAQAMAPLIVALGPEELAAAVRRANEDHAHAVTVFLADGSIIGQPATRTPAVELAASGASTTADVAGGREVLVAVVGLPSGTAVIRTYVSDEELGRGVSRAWLILALLGLSLLTVSVIVAYRLSSTMTQPLMAAAEVSDRLARGDLRARAVPGGPPEVRRVGNGLNHLAGQISVLLAREREAAADLSHRMRTPLTAMRIDAETLRDPREQERIVAHVDALQRTIDDIIRSARHVDTPSRPSCDATAVVRERAQFWSALADEEERRFEVRIEEGVTAAIAAEDLAACVDALLGNVFAHTPEGVPWVVELRRYPEGGACLAVVDRGPGMMSTLRHRGASGSGSTGLGLDIVARTAATSGGGMSITQTSGGGTTVTVAFG